VQPRLTLFLRRVPARLRAAGCGPRRGHIVSVIRSPLSVWFSRPERIRRP
jgi:hypothetical protein